MAYSLNLVGRILAKQGQYAEARAMHKRALDIFTARLGGEHPEVVTTTQNLAKLAVAQGHHAEAASYYAQVLPLREPGTVKWGETAFYLAGAQWDQGVDRAGALELALRARAALGTVSGEDIQLRERVDAWIAARTAD